jgi:ribosomal protein S18 acetylase RimI-like enzyme
MNTRWLSSADLAAWRSLRSEALRLFPEAFLTSLQDFENQSDDSVSTMLDQGNMLGLFQGENLIGAGAFLPFKRAQTRHRAEIGAFYVSPDHHGKGAADVLMDALKHHATEIDVIQLELFAWVGNPRAIRFYQRHGFVEMGRLPNAVIVDGDQRDDLFMVRQS